MGLVGEALWVLRCAFVKTKPVLSVSLLSASTAPELSLSFYCVHPGAKLKLGEQEPVIAFRGLSTGESVCVYHQVPSRFRGADFYHPYR